MEPGSSLPHSQEPATWPYPEPAKDTLMFMKMRFTDWSINWAEDAFSSVYVLLKAADKMLHCACS
jgi:hypothetical protein